MVVVRLHTQKIREQCYAGALFPDCVVVLPFLKLGKQRKLSGSSFAGMYDPRDEANRKNNGIEKPL